MQAAFIYKCELPGRCLLPRERLIKVGMPHYYFRHNRVRVVLILRSPLHCIN